MTCPWPHCGKPAVKYVDTGIYVVMCREHWGVLVTALRAMEVKE